MSRGPPACRRVWLCAHVCGVRLLCVQTEPLPRLPDVQDFKAFVLDRDAHKGIFLSPVRSLDDALSLSAAGHLPALLGEFGWVPAKMDSDEAAAAAATAAAGGAAAAAGGGSDAVLPGPAGTTGIVWRRRDAHLNGSSGGPGAVAATAKASAPRGGLSAAGAGALDDFDEDFVLSAGSMTGPAVVLDVESFLQHGLLLCLIVTYPVRRALSSVCVCLAAARAHRVCLPAPPPVVCARGGSRGGPRRPHRSGLRGAARRRSTRRR